MYVFISNHLSGVFQLSFLGFGPTELRLCLIAINAAMYVFGDVGFGLGGQEISAYDCALILAGVVFISIYVVRVATGIRTYRDPAAVQAATDQSAARKSFRPPK